MQALFSHKVITKEALIVKSSIFKQTLSKVDKGSWYPILRENSFVQKLPGTISQNSKWIQYLSLLLYSELINRKDFLKTKEWQLFLLLKELCEHYLSNLLSDHQIDEQTGLLHQYLKIRLSLISDTDADVKKVGPITPKHLFAMNYAEIQRRVGLIVHYHTNRFESKNGFHKRKIKVIRDLF